MKTKQILIVTDSRQADIPIATLVVDCNVNLKNVNDDIACLKKNIPNWHVSDILDGLTINFEELPLDCISI